MNPGLKAWDFCGWRGLRTHANPFLKYPALKGRVSAGGRMKYKMIIAYDGTDYGGWQVQPNAVSIQSLIQKALSTILRAEVDLTGSGRTDAGVHAIGQTAHFVAGSIDLEKILVSLNGLLPSDIRILSLEPVSEDFHARYSSRSKIYRYHLHLDRIPDPFKRRFAYHVPHPVDLTLLQNAATHFIGTHDFTSFANVGSAFDDAIRTLYRLDLIEEKGGVALEFEGDGFLYKMVRNLVGTLLDIAAGKMDLKEVPAILAAKDRRAAGITAPPHGLFLVEVKY